MPNHIHALVQTPLPNLASGMQHWLSGYANWYAKRNQRTGHLFQGRYKALLVEDGGYYWTLSRYIHLNCVSGTRPLVDQPESWPHSSYPGYCRNPIACPGLPTMSTMRTGRGKTAERMRTRPIASMSRKASIASKIHSRPDFASGSSAAQTS